MTSSHAQTRLQGYVSSCVDLRFGLLRLSIGVITCVGGLVGGGMHFAGDIARSSAVITSF